MIRGVKHSPESHTDTQGNNTEDGSLDYKKVFTIFLSEGKEKRYNVMNEAVVTNELFDLVRYVQPWNYNLPLIWRWIHGASLVALTEPVRHNTAPRPSDHYGTSNYKKKSRWDVDVIAVWVLLHV